MTAQTVDEWTEEAEAELDCDAHSPDARALRWHLFHIASRLRGAHDAFPEARRWARALLVGPPEEEPLPEAVALDGSASGRGGL